MYRQSLSQRVKARMQKMPQGHPCRNIKFAPHSITPCTIHIPRLENLLCRAALPVRSPIGFASDQMIQFKAALVAGSSHRFLKTTADRRGRTSVRSEKKNANFTLKHGTKVEVKVLLIRL
jgi:hypothetical protein